MENELKHDENLSDEISSETSFVASTLPSSSSRDESTAVQSRTGSRFYIPFCASMFYVMAASGFACMFAMRVSLSVALVAMINQTAIATDDVVTINITNISNTDQCPRDPALQRADGEFTWDRHQQGALLAANFYGILVTQVWSKYQNLETESFPRMQCNNGMAHKLRLSVFSSNNKTIE